MLRIEHLSQEQIDKFPEYVNRWNRIGLSTDPIDFERAKYGFRMAYKCAGLNEPKAFIRLKSPIAGAIGAALFDQVMAQVGDQVWDQVWAQVRDQVWDQVRDQVGDQVGAQVMAQVMAQVGAQVGAQVRDQVWDQVLKACFGAHEASWLAFYSFFRQECHLECCANLEGLNLVAMDCGWWWPFENVVIITDRPVELHFDSNSRCHNASGAAILYSDGFSVFMWHGWRVERSVICDPVTVDRIENESNAEIRRILIERYGTTKYVQDSGSVRVSSDDFGTLYRKDEPNDVAIYVVKLICPTTSREYFLGIDPSAYGGLAGKSARAAVASTWRKNDGSMAFATPELYAPVCET